MLWHIQQKADGAQIIVIDDFWDAEKHEMKKAVCEQLSIDFVDLSDIRDDEAFQASMGASVLGDDEKEHIIEHDGVATHPGDEGMAVIAERVIEVVKE